ncbi:hypothetical protein EN852_002230 [Mesorhizobium sp. M2E.F.Ca.ET.209.01.1.1]|uniref:hypothetical protein n=1 Tax=Mesorhizobium sp. M2E.F.Ca.ET.209.01.1.1 TaxID=2500526 RepID=UPI000FDA6675|nr:hypothetical protein [Mesorhizobium sp. M2E.F.Ca.ET.209.01.1.1]RWL50227.1 MAG: hypothetical protein EOR60_02395 [Mesorhizobium sp.]TGS19162.1 hypothetical protein EN852_002230 [Mesorhizobium sp. M2E.F.Ca.ET.209.01.1.1]
MTKPRQDDDPARSTPSRDRTGQQTGTDRDSPQEDPVEGSRKVVDRELARQKPSTGAGKDEAEQSLRDQIEEETELPQKGSA